MATITATVEGKSGSAPLEVVRVPVAGVTVSPASVPLVIGQTFPLSVTLKDAAGGTLLDRAVSWESSDPTVVSVSTSGIVTGAALGSAIVTATSEGKTGSSTIAVAPLPFAILNVTPDTLRPGAQATLTMQSLPTGIPTVTVGAIPAHVVSSAGGSITIDVPSGYGCDVPSAAAINVSAGNATATRSHPLVPSAVLTLAPGDVQASVVSPGATCVAVGPTTGHYYVLVYNVNSVVNASADFQFAGRVAGVTNPNSIMAAGPSSLQPQDPDAAAHAKFLALAAAAHLRQRSLDSVVLLQSAARSTAARARGQISAGGVAASLPSGIDPVVGHPSTPRLDGGGCNSFVLLNGRTVYSGLHLIIIEDNTSPTAGTIDPYWQWLGTEFDTRMFPLGQAYFGNIFARDVSGSGKVLAIATPGTNAVGAAGLAAVCGFWPRSVNPASNEMPQVYLNVPLLPSDVAFWETYTPATLMHESFHEIHFSERLAQTEGPNAFESRMIGEGLADYAAAIYLRDRCGWPARNNTGFAGISQCEQHENSLGHPVAILSDFWYGGFAIYIADIETHSPLSDGYSPSLQFIRQAIDNSGLDEATTLKSIVSDVSHVGLAGLVAHVGRSFDLLMADWAVGVATDGYAGFLPAARFQIPAWSLRDIYLGLKANGLTTVDYPISLHPLTNGPVATTVPILLAGSVSIIEFRSTTTASFALSFGLDPNLRVAVVRLK